MPPVSSILITTSTFPRDADDPVSARFVFDLARHLARHVRVTVLAPGAPGVPRRERWEGIDIVRHRYFIPDRLQLVTSGEGILAAVRNSRLARLQLPFLVASQWAVLPRIVREKSVDLVNSHWIVPQGFNLALWKRRLGVHHVVTAHAADVAYLRRSFFGAALTRFILDRTDYFLPVSAHLANEIQDLAGRRIRHRVVPMGVSTDRFTPSTEPASLRSSPDEKVLLFVGKLVPKKGVDVLVEALAGLRRRGWPVRLVLVGGGPLEEHVRARAGALRVAGAVDLKGWCRNEELPRYYAAADVVCVPSVRDEKGETEGMPVVIQEALAMGSVVVASEISGIPDVLRDGENGFLVPPNDPAALADVLETVLSMSGGSERKIRTAARGTAREHSWERVAERYLESFGEVCSGGDAREIPVTGEVPT